MSAVPNPPAFPLSWEETNQHGHTYPIIETGMTLRDWFAGQALAAVVETCASDTAARKGVIEDFFARKSYALADAMLAERVKVKP